MHELYYKGRIETRVNHVKSGFNTNRAVRLGSTENPLTLTLTNESRKAEIELLLTEHNLHANIDISETGEENINQLTAIIETPTTTTFEKTPGRNDSCSCDSGKKYKKCCG
jgi:SWIM/SEC-C metal-binding protein